MTESAQTNGPDPDKLKNYIERIENIDAQRIELNADKSQLMQDAKAEGFNTKIIKKIVALRKLDPGEREAEAEELELYADAIGMQLKLPILEDDIGGKAKRGRGGRKVAA